MTKKGPASKEPIEITRLDQIKNKPIPWLWERRIPLGMMTVLYGQPKIGKGVICASLASMVTRGTLLGDLYDDPANVLIAWSEDPNASTTLGPQIKAAGGDPQRIGSVSPFIIAEGTIAHIQARMERDRTVLLVIDQLLDFLDPALADKLGLDAVRPPLKLLVDLANKTGAAVLVVLHESDKAQTKKIMNSTAFTALPRVHLRAYGKPSTSDPSGWKNRSLQVIRSNPPTDHTPLEYETIAVRTDHEGDEVIDDEVITIRWLSEIETPSVAAPELNGQGQVEQAAFFLRDFLKRGPRELPEIVERAEKKGLSKSALDRASRQIKVVKTRTGVGPEHVGVWTLK
jgi:hypothetical protein